MTGTLTAPAIVLTCESMPSREIAWPSGNPSTYAMPALVVAIAGNPIDSTMRALAPSHALTNTTGVA